MDLIIIFNSLKLFDIPIYSIDLSRSNSIIIDVDNKFFTLSEFRQVCCVKRASSNANIAVLFVVISITPSLVRACAVSTFERVSV